MKQNSDFNHALKEILAEIKKYCTYKRIIGLLIDFIIANFEQKSLHFSKKERRRSWSFRKKILQLFPGNVLTLRSGILRKPFLSASIDFFIEKSDLQPKVEWRIIGFGEKRGNSTNIWRIVIEEGTEDGVYSDINVKRAILSHLQEKDCHQVIFIHNHAYGIRRLIKNLIVGEIAVASSFDRKRAWETLGDNLLVRLHQIKKHKLLFYIFENSQIKEYKPVPVNMSKLVLQYLSEI